MTSVLSALALLQTAAVFDQGMYVTYVDGKETATEGFKILDDGRSSSIISKVENSSPKVVRKTEFATDFGGLRSAVINSVGREVLRLRIDDAKVVYADGAELSLDGGQSVFAADTFAWHNRTILFHTYRPEGGRQNYQIIIPSQRLVATFTLDRQGERTLNEKQVVDWTAAVGGLEQSYVTDTDGRLLYGRVPGQKLEIVRKGYEFLRESGAAAPPAAHQPNRDKYDEREVGVWTGSSTRLAGTLTVPKTAGRHPAVLLLSGAGAQDRNWDMPPQITHSAAMQIADRLAAAGYVVLRCDDRGVGKSTGPKYAPLANLVSDARSLVNYLKALPEANPFNVVVAGHSEGGVIAAMLAAEDASLGGCIIIAAPSRPFDQIIVEQLSVQEADSRLPEALREQAARLIPRMNEVIAKARAGERGQMEGIDLGWLRGHMAHNPTETIKKVQSPILIVQGLDDLMVLSRNAAELEAAAKGAGRDVTVVLIPRSTHFFTKFPYENPEFDPGEPAAMIPQLWEAMIAWLDQKVGQQGFEAQGGQ